MCVRVWDTPRELLLALPCPSSFNPLLRCPTVTCLSTQARHTCAYICTPGHTRRRKYSHVTEGILQDPPHVSVLGSLALHARGDVDSVGTPPHMPPQSSFDNRDYSALVFSPQRPTGFAQQGPWQLAWRQVRQTRAAWPGPACTHARTRRAPFCLSPRLVRPDRQPLFSAGHGTAQPSPGQPQARSNHRQTARPP
jgi:hypothetical protein